MAAVDVFVPCYNYGRYLRDCVNSVLKQDGVEVRVLILDDASTDETPAVGQHLAERDGRVEYRRHPENRGHVRTYNEGIEWAAAAYCLLLSADDLLTRGALARATGLMEAHPGVGLTYGEPVRTETPEFDAVPPPGSYAVEVIPGPAFVERCCDAGTNLVEAVTAVVRTRVQKQVGGYRPELPHSCDLEMWLRCAAVAGVGRVHAPQGFYRRHATNMSNGYAQQKEFYQIRDAFHSFFAAAGDGLPGALRLRGLADQRLATEAFYIANEAFNAGDLARCGQMLVEAKALCAEVRKLRGWRMLQIKRLLGNRVWNYMRPLLQASN